MPSLVDDVGRVLREQGEDLNHLHPKTLEFISCCEQTAKVNYQRENDAYSRQVKAIVVASARTFDAIIKELDTIKDDVHTIRDSIKDGQ